jgi:tetratricopeptide (TPR) repeat protein
MFIKARVRTSFAQRNLGVYTAQQRSWTLFMNMPNPLPKSRRGTGRFDCCARLLALAMLTCVPAMRVHAEKPTAEGVQAAESGEPAGYADMVSEAVREYEAHNFEEARALLTRAHGLYPNARTHRGLGLAEFELRNYGEAISHLEAALASSVKPLSSKLRADTEHMLERAKGFVARVHLDAKPSVTRVVVDGTVVELSSGQPLILQVGDHVLELNAPGFVAEKRVLSVKGGEERVLTVVLALTPQPKPTFRVGMPMANTSPADKKPQRHWYKNPWLWTGVGVAIAGAAAGTAYALTKQDDTASPYGGSAGLLLKGP